MIANLFMCLLVICALLEKHLFSSFDHRHLCFYVIFSLKGILTERRRESQRERSIEIFCPLILAPRCSQWPGPGKDKARSPKLHRASCTAVCELFTSLSTAFPGVLARNGIKAKQPGLEPNLLCHNTGSKTLRFKNLCHIVPPGFPQMKFNFNG